MKHKKSLFNNPLLPYLLLAPQVLVTVLFFIFPAFSALQESFYRGDAFGIKKTFAGFDNFYTILTNPLYLQALKATLIFSLGVSLLALISALFLALLTHHAIKGREIYKSLLIWPYAVAPAVAGILWRFLFNPAVGTLAYALDKMGYHWDYTLNGRQAMLLVIIAAAWQQLSYNYIFFLAGLQAIPNALMEAAAIDGAGPFRRFWSIIFPLLSPTTFFLLTMNMIYAFFNTFGVIQTVTQGGPANATNILVYKVYNDGFLGLDLGGSAAQSVVLMLIVTFLTVLQFRYIERKVHY